MGTLFAFLVLGIGLWIMFLFIASLFSEDDYYANGPRATRRYAGPRTRRNNDKIKNAMYLMDTHKKVNEDKEGPIDFGHKTKDGNGTYKVFSNVRITNVNIGSRWVIFELPDGTIKKAKSPMKRAMPRIGQKGDATLLYRKTSDGIKVFFFQLYTDEQKNQGLVPKKASQQAVFKNEPAGTLAEVEGILLYTDGTMVVLHTDKGKLFVKSSMADELSQGCTYKVNMISAYGTKWFLQKYELVYDSHSIMDDAYTRLE